jgi:hypothetical protein
MAARRMNRLVKHRILGVERADSPETLLFMARI